MSAPEAEFIEIFRDEATERLDRIVATLMALEAGRPPADAVDSLFRDVHTIKGAAGMVGLVQVGALAHAMEDVFEATREQGAFPTHLIDVLLRAADALRRHVDGGSEPVTDLIAEIAGSLAGAESAEPDPTPDVHAAPHRSRRSIRVAPEKIDALLDLVGETVLHRKRLEHAIGPENDGDRLAISAELDAGERLLDNLKESAIGMRTLPLSSIVGPLPRAVRDLGVETGKEVELVIEGDETEIDRAILESLSDLLVHILRNAVAHGIESPAERERSGKPVCGRLTVHAEQRGGTVEVTISDDGRGVSEEILAEARRVGSLTDVLAAPGFSTAGDVTDIAGRGVGLDAVKTQVELFGGTLEVRSEPQRGTDVTLRLPLALALLEVLLVERAGNVYGLPLASVEEAVSVSEILSLTGQQSVEVRGTAIPVADLAQLVGALPTSHAERPPAIIIHSGGRRIAAICDTLLGKDEIVVKRLGPLLDSLTNYLGAAILGDGRIALLLDPAKLVRGAARRKHAHTTFVEPQAAPTRNGNAQAPKLLVVEDSLAIRELQRSILQTAGYRVETAKNGHDALEQLERNDASDAFELVLTDVDMPELDGLSLTRAIRAHSVHSAVPVVVVTSRDTEADRRAGMEAGADAYMVKRGFDQQLLLDTVERLIGR